MDRRWSIGLAPPVAAAAVLAALASGSLGASDAAWEPSACAGGKDALVAAARAAPPAVPADLARSPWFTLDPVADEAGVLAGQRLRVGLGSARGRYLDAPAESAASGPFGRLVLIVADDGQESSVTALDRAANCAFELGTSEDVIRRATLDLARETVYEFRVDRSTRADLGVWSRPLDRSQARQVVGPIGQDARFGPTFTTTLTWATGGHRLAIQSCGALLCRTRLLDPDTGLVDAPAAPGQGELVGVVGATAVHYALCTDLPCPVVATDTASGVRRTLIEGAGLARIVATSDGPRLVFEVARAGGRIDVARLDGTVEASLAIADPALRLMPAGDRAAAGVDMPPGWIVLAPDGRSPERAVLMRLTDGRTVGLAEVLQ